MVDFTSWEFWLALSGGMLFGYLVLVPGAYWVKRVLDGRFIDVSEPPDFSPPDLSYEEMLHRNYHIRRGSGPAKDCRFCPHRIVDGEEGR